MSYQVTAHKLDHMVNPHLLISRVSDYWRTNRDHIGSLRTVDRLASLLIGATVIVLVAQRFLFYLGLVSVGVYLLYRGASGVGAFTTNPAHRTPMWRAALPVLERSKGYEQNNLTRQMATNAGQSQKRVGPAYG